MSKNWQEALKDSAPVTVDDVLAAKRRLFESRQFSSHGSDSGPLPYAEHDLFLGASALRRGLDTDAEIYLATETPKKGKSFKWRGAANLMLSLVEQGGKFTPVAASAGNHAQGLALVMRYLGEQGVLQKLHIGNAKIFMPESTPPVKVNAVRELGGDYVEIVRTGRIFDDAYKAAQALVASDPAAYKEIPPFNNREVMAGQGLVALDIIDNLLGRNADSPPLSKGELKNAIQESGLAKKSIEVYVPVGGGGLVAGMSTVFKEFLPNAKVIGVEPSYAPSAIESLKHGGQKPLDTSPPTADGRGLPMATGVNVRQIGDKTLAMMQKNGVSVTTVDNDQIKYTTNLFAQSPKQYGEGGGRLPIPEESGVVSLAALIADSKRPSSLQKKGDAIKIAVVSGANIDQSVLNGIQAAYGTIDNPVRDITQWLENFPTAEGLPEYTAAGRGIH